jgi:serine phosphatase RsbU (regulator of sigma subunit)
VASPAARFPHTGILAAAREWLGKGRGRWLGMAVAVIFTAAILLPDPGPLPPLRVWAFDTYQARLPRTRVLDPAVIVAVDDQSLRRIGQWPWSRDVLARLIDRIAERQPAAIAVDMLFTEPDRSSPDRLADYLSSRDRALAKRLSELRPNDDILAESLTRARAVVGVAGVEASIAKGSPSAPSEVSGPPAPLPRYAGALRSLPRLDHAAAGHGLLNADPERGIVRRVPLAAYLGEQPVLTLALESFRVAAGLPSFTLNWNTGGMRSVQIGDLEVPSQPNGRAWIHFSPHDPRRYVSAADVLEGKDDPRRIKQSIVLVGVTALALLDQNTTARGERMPGIEIHAQLVENIVENGLLSRPASGRYVEALAFVLAAGLLIVVVPRTRSRVSFSVLAGCWVLLIAAGVAAYAFTRTLFDPTTPIAGMTLLFGLMLSATLVASDRHRRQLSAHLAAEREAAARVTGELEAAQRIQTGMLPKRESVLRNERRIEIFAHMKAAREVGGDLYDFFPLPGDRFVVIVGDVSDKGLPAAMFMAVSKALVRSCALRTPVGAAALMTMFNAEISRENPEQLFVTLFALIADLRTGEVEYCNAGHEPPILVRRSGETLILDDGGGPPLCVVDDYPYEAGRVVLEPRDMLTLASDGITEAMNRTGALYGRARLKALVELPSRRDVDVTILGSEILAAIKTFEAGSEPSDDQTLLLFSWRGSG